MPNEQVTARTGGRNSLWESPSALVRARMAVYISPGESPLLAHGGGLDGLGLRHEPTMGPATGGRGGCNATARQLTLAYGDPTELEQLKPIPPERLHLPPLGFLRGLGLSKEAQEESEPP